MAKIALRKSFFFHFRLFGGGVGFFVKKFIKNVDKDINIAVSYTLSESFRNVCDTSNMQRSLKALNGIISPRSRKLIEILM